MFINEKSLYILNMLLIICQKDSIKDSYAHGQRMWMQEGMAWALTDNLSKKMTQMLSAKWGPMETGTWWKQKPFLFISMQN